MRTILSMLKVIYILNAQRVIQNKCKIEYKIPEKIPTNIIIMREFNNNKQFYHNNNNLKRELKSQEHNPLKRSHFFLNKYLLITLNKYILSV